MEVIYLIEYIIVRIIFYILSFVPLSILKIGATIVGTIGYCILGKRREVALQNLRLAFKDEKTEKEIRRIARMSCINLIYTYIEFMHFPRFLVNVKNRFVMDEDSRKRINEAVHADNSLIYLTAHFGNWEFLSLFAGDDGQQLSSIGRAVKNHYIADFVNRMRCLAGSAMLDKEDAVKGAMKAIRNNEQVGILVDQRAGNSGIEVKYFGEPVSATPFPALMKIKFGSVLLPIFCIRKKVGAFQIVVGDGIDIPADLSDSDETIHYVVQTYTGAIENIVRKFPEQWLWYHRRWRL